MALPTSYTETEFKEYLNNQLSASIAGSLGWTVDGGSYDEIVIDVELVLGQVIADVTNIRSLRAVGRRELWRTVMQVTSNKATAATGVAGSIAFGRTIFDRAKDLFTQASEEVERLMADADSSRPFQFAVV